MQCSGGPSVAPFSVEMVGPTLLQSCFSNDFGHTTLRIQTQLPPAPAMTLRGQHSGLRGSRGVCQHPCENHISVSDALLHLLRGSAVPARQARPVPPTAPHNHCWPRLQPQAALAPQISLSQRGPSRGPGESQDPLWWLSHKAAVTLARCGLCVSEYRPGKRGGKVKRRQLENELKVWSRRGKTCSVPSHRH